MTISGKSFKKQFYEVIKNSHFPKDVVISDELSVRNFLYQHIQDIGVTEGAISKYLEYLFVTCFTLSGKIATFNQETYHIVCWKEREGKLDKWVALLGGLVRESLETGKRKQVLSIIEAIDNAVHRQFLSHEEIYKCIVQSVRNLLYVNQTEEVSWSPARLKPYLSYQSLPLAKLYVLSLQLGAKGNAIRTSNVPLLHYKEIFSRC